jgi:hypothetical protein
MSFSGCARVMSQTEIATVCPGETRSRSGGHPTGERIAWSSVARAGDRRPRHRLDDRRPLAREVDFQAVGSVVQSYSRAFSLRIVAWSARPARRVYHPGWWLVDGG